MTTHDWTDRPGNPPLLPLERPVREALRVYTVRIVAILFTQILIIIVMLAVFLLVMWARQASWGEIASAAVGALLGLFIGKRRVLADTLTRQWKRVGAAAEAFTDPDRAPRRGRIG